MESDLIVDIWIKSVKNDWVLRVYLVLTLTFVLSMYPIFNFKSGDF